MANVVEKKCVTVIISGRPRNRKVCEVLKTMGASASIVRTKRRAGLKSVVLPIMLLFATFRMAEAMIDVGNWMNGVSGRGRILFRNNGDESGTIVYTVLLMNNTQADYLIEGPSNTEAACKTPGDNDTEFPNGKQVHELEYQRIFFAADRPLTAARPSLLNEDSTADALLTRKVDKLKQQDGRETGQRQEGSADKCCSLMFKLDGRTHNDDGVVLTPTDKAMINKLNLDVREKAHDVTLSVFGAVGAATGLAWSATNQAVKQANHELVKAYIENNDAFTAALDSEGEVEAYKVISKEGKTPYDAIDEAAKANNLVNQPIIKKSALEAAEAQDLVGTKAETVVTEANEAWKEGELSVVVEDKKYEFATAGENAFDGGMEEIFKMRKGATFGFGSKERTAADMLGVRHDDYVMDIAGDDTGVWSPTRATSWVTLGPFLGVFILSLFLIAYCWCSLKDLNKIQRKHNTDLGI